MENQLNQNVVLFPFIEKINKNDKPLARLLGKKRQKQNPNNWYQEWKGGHTITTDPVKN